MANAGFRAWVTRIGTAGLVFFLVKGLLWVMLAAAVWLLR